MRTRLSVLVLAVALVAVPAAAAKTWFGSIGGKAYRPGQVVLTEVAGCRTPCPVRGTVVYLSGAASTSTARRVGVVDRAGRLRFTIPRLAPGSYRLVARPAPRLAPRAVSTPFRIT